MGLDSNEFFESDETLPKDELEDLLNINSRTFRYYKENGFLKETRTKGRGRYTLSPRDIDFLGFIRDLKV